MPSRRTCPACSTPLLTARELEIAKLIAEGGTGKEIAQALRISEKTVEAHRANLHNRIGVHNAVQLCRWYLKHIQGLDLDAVGRVPVRSGVESVDVGGASHG